LSSSSTATANSRCPSSALAGLRVPHRALREVAREVEPLHDRAALGEVREARVGRCLDVAHAALVADQARPEVQLERRLELPGVALAADPGPPDGAELRDVRCASTSTGRWRPCCSIAPSGTSTAHSSPLARSSAKAGAASSSHR
jgi:hypothetical protein